MDSSLEYDPLIYEKKEQLDGIIEKWTEYLRFLQTAQKGQHLEPGHMEYMRNWKRELALAYNERGRLHYSMVEYGKAMDDYTKAIRYCNTLVSAYYNRGTLRYRMGCFDLALLDLEEALCLEPNNKMVQLRQREVRQLLYAPLK